VDARPQFLATLVQTVLVDLSPVVRQPGVRVVRVSVSDGLDPVELPLAVWKT
jgi:hypothetical protein